MIRINKNRIIDTINDKKASSIKESFNIMKDTNRPSDQLLFLENIKNKSSEYIMENLQYIHQISIGGITFLNDFINTNTIPINILKEEYLELKKFMSDNTTNEYYTSTLNNIQEIIGTNTFNKFIDDEDGDIVLYNGAATDIQPHTHLDETDCLWLYDFRLATIWAFYILLKRNPRISEDDIRFDYNGRPLIVINKKVKEEAKYILKNNPVYVSAKKFFNTYLPTSDKTTLYGYRVDEYIYPDIELEIYYDDVDDEFITYKDDVTLIKMHQIYNPLSDLHFDDKYIMYVSMNKLNNSNYYLNVENTRSIDTIQLKYTNIKRRNDIGSIDDMRDYLNYKNTCYVSESTDKYISKMDIIKNNINASPYILQEYSELLKDIAISNSYSMSEYPKLLMMNTDMIINFKDPKGRGIDTLISLPILLVEKILSFKVPLSQLKLFIKIYDAEIIKCYKMLNDNTVAIEMYIGKLEQGKAMLEENYKYGKHELLEFHIGDMEPILDDNCYSEAIVEDIDLDFDVSLNELLNVEESVNKPELWAALNRHLLYEGKIVSTAVKAGETVEKGSLKVSNKVEDVHKDIKRIKEPFKRALTPFSSKIIKTFDDIKKSKEKARRERVLSTEGYGYYAKLMKLVHSTILGLGTGHIVGVALNPLLGIISAITAVALSNRLDSKERKKVLQELEDELKIINEKLDDAKSDSDKKSKYELMRIKNKLEHDIERLKFRLD
jgi:hypothetical protein